MTIIDVIAVLIGLSAGLALVASGVWAVETLKRLARNREQHLIHKHYGQRPVVWN